MLTFFKRNRKSSPESHQSEKECKPPIKKNQSDFFLNRARLGCGNFRLFQKFPYFKWPAWAVCSADRDSELFRPSSPPFFFNNVLRDAVPFANSMFGEELYIDPSFMISTSYDCWSVEPWVYDGEKLRRPADDMKKISQKWDSSNVFVTSWDEGTFKVTGCVYGVKSGIDEAVLEIRVLVREKKKSSLVFSVRPYNYEKLGGVESVEYQKDPHTVKINGTRKIYIEKEPDSVLKGNGESGDIQFGKDDSHRVSCSHGMAALSFCYNLKKGDNVFYFRISLIKEGEIQSRKYDSGKLIDEYRAACDSWLKSGFNFKCPDRLLVNWFFGTKGVLRGIITGDFTARDGSTQWKNLFYALHGYHRMGYHGEARTLIDLGFERSGIKDRELSFDDCINICYCIISVADYYTHLRDLEYLQGVYESLRKHAEALHKKISGIKTFTGAGTNSIDDYYIDEGHGFDLILFSNSLFQFSYLSRCMGIFNEEIKFSKAAERLSDIFLKNVLNGEFLKNEFFHYYIFSGFPFRLDKISDQTLRSLAGTLTGNNGGPDIAVRSIGQDMFGTVILINNLIRLRDERAYEYLCGFLKKGKEKHIFPEYVSLTTGRGCWGKGCSKFISAMIFSCIRNLLFIDHPERLELFPVDIPSWFEAGSEIIIENAPSRFGLLNLKVTATSGEVLFFFNTLPKFVPPDILINLPVSASIEHADDFIVKKADGKLFLINGWPSQVKFIRK